ncbi:hypothetical protein H5410_057660 [Solanum commersonii]|uniref:Uncharacterized protein n=1 Tax=Solanum commersonii TaxID=4109 RepID=A0A9J5WRF8_SOLCO|nr:hypothetical protein H5410_057660 [Solanum commersonii]
MGVGSGTSCRFRSVDRIRRLNGGRKNVNTSFTLVDSRLLVNNDQVPTTPPRATDPVASLENDLAISRKQNDALRTEIETMRTNLAESQGKLLS